MGWNRPRKIVPGNQADHLGVPRPRAVRPPALQMAQSRTQAFRSCEAAGIPMVEVKNWHDCAIGLEAHSARVKYEQNMAQEREEQSPSEKKKQPFLLRRPWARKDFSPLPPPGAQLFDTAFVGPLSRRYVLAHQSAQATWDRLDRGTQHVL